MTIPKLTPYTGQVANPDGSQTQTEFTQNMFGQLSYEAQLATELDATIDGMNQAVTDVENNTAAASASATSAEASASTAGYQGLWPDAGGSAEKGDTYQTQVGGTPTGQYFTALQNTTVDPVGDDVNWKAINSHENLVNRESYNAHPASSIRGVKEMRDELLGGSVFPESPEDVAAVGDVIPSQYSHIRTQYGLMLMSPQVSGTISEITEATIRVGSSTYASLTPVSRASNPLNTSTTTVYATLNDRFNEIVARMSGGDTINIACYGDSTTDGNGTTGWIKNPTTGFNENAIGNSNHNLNSPNSWPVKLEAILRDMHSNNNISVWNAGYAGQQIADGWAVANYDTAVINNPFYGTPDITIIAFGLNDVQLPGSDITDFVNQSRILIRKVIDDGTVPVLMTSDPHYRNGTNSIRDHKEVRRELDSAKLSLAKEFGIPIFDMGLALKGWIQNNNDGYNWIKNQPDALHFDDAGHAFKASFLASKLFNDVFEFTGGDQYLNSWSSQSSYVGDYANNIYTLANNKQGGNINLSPSSPANTDLMTAWVWSECPNTYLIYLGIDGENVSTYTTPPAIEVTDHVTGSTVSKDIISVGGFNSSFRRSDEQFIHGRMKYGLNKVVYKSGDSTDQFYGSFRFVESLKALPSNVLGSSGRFSRSYMASTGVHVDVIPESKLLENTVGGFDGETVSISIHMKTPQNGGVILQYGQGFNSTQSAIDNNMQSGVLLFRKVDDSLQILNIAWDDTGAVTFSSPIASSTAQSWINDEFVGRIELTRESNQQRYKVFDAWAGGSEIISTLTALSASTRWAGTVGGVFYNSDVAAIGGTVEVLNMSINR